MNVDAKLVQESGHMPTPLSPAERMDLASITSHPGMSVLVGKIIETHVKQQMDEIHKVKLNDADRLVKLDAICALAQAMRLTAEIIKMEIAHNFKTLADAEEARAREAKKNEEKAQ